MRNIDIQNFKTSLQNLMTQSGLPIGIVYYILKLEQKQLQKIYYATLNQELAQQQQKEEEEEKQQNEEK